MTGCKSNPCKGVVTYKQVDTRLTGYIFKPGSYWVYYDSIDGIRDSQYVYSYSYLTHYRNPADTPTPVYQGSSPGVFGNDAYCGPFYMDSIAMAYISYQNGMPIDTMRLFSCTPFNYLNYRTLLLWENFFPGSLNFVACFQLNPPDSIEQEYSAYNEPSLPIGDTLNFWYRGNLSSLSTPTLTFNNVSVFGVQLIDQNSTRFKYPTDLYFASGSGIVKMVQHKPAADIAWILVNYHIVN